MAGGFVNLEGIPFDSLFVRRQSPDFRRYIRHIRRRRLRTYLHPFFRKTHPTRERFILLSQVRCGSHLVQSLVNQHPDVHCDAEMFKLRRTVLPALLLKNAAAARREPVFGFMLKPYQPVRDQRASTERWIEWLRDVGCKLVYLKRSDKLRQAVSAYSAIERQIWINRAGDKASRDPVWIDPVRLLKIRAFIESWTDVEQRWVEALPSIQFVYEDDLESSAHHQRVADSIFEFVGVESVPVKAQIEPVLPQDPGTFVTNWEEVLEAWNR